MAKKKLWNIRIEEPLIDKLGRLGAHLGYKSGNMFVADALSEFAETIAEMMAELESDRTVSKKRIHDKVITQLRSERRK